MLSIRIVSCMCINNVNISGIIECDCEDFHLLGYNAMQSTESQLTFQRNMSPKFSGLKNKPSSKPVTQMFLQNIS
jgi:hypothetical protein